jgi:peptidoglycan/xylan/chitin deacetylase (PgdA/CDA1 family)
MREGHELGNHLVHDVSAFRSSAKQFEDDLLECDALIASLVRRMRVGPAGTDK